MASIERTAYPQFKRNPVVRELVAAYTPTEADIAFVTAQARQPGHRLTLAVFLKCFQRLGYFPSFDDVPASVVRHVRGALSYRVQIKPANVVEQTRIIRTLMREGWKISRDDLAVLSPYVTSHIKRFGDYLIEAELIPDPYEGDLPLAA